MEETQHQSPRTCHLKPSDYTTQFKTCQVVIIKDISSPWSCLYPSTVTAAIRLFLLQHGHKSASRHKASHLLRGTWETRRLKPCCAKEAKSKRQRIPGGCSCCSFLWYIAELIPTGVSRMKGSRAGGSARSLAWQKMLLPMARVVLLRLQSSRALTPASVLFEQ